jgi:glycogen debranching enzyme
MDELKEKVANLMSSNYRQVNGYSFTMPAPERYPFQWFWDSCFHAHIYTALNDTDRAKSELRSVTSQPTSGGMLPHIIFWESIEGIRPNWGRELRGGDLDAAFGHKGVSNLTQPPLIARTLYETYLASQDDNFLAELYPIVKNHFDYLARERTVQHSPLLFIINPDESGEDNSPRFDELLSLPHQHQASENLDKRIDLMQKLVDCDFNTKICMQQYFAVYDVGFNCVYYDGLLALGDIAQQLGKTDDQAQFVETATHVKEHMRNTLSDEQGRFYSFDLIREKHIAIDTWNMFMPLYAKILEPNEAVNLTRCLFDSQTFMGKRGLRTVSATEPSYDPVDGFWRGPTWLAPYWFISKGLRAYGLTTEAEQLTQQAQSLVATSDFFEQYHPDTGVGEGASLFTWSGLVLDM